MEKEFVRIQSTMNITVTGGLQAQDVTNPDAHVPDRLKVQPLWPMTTVDIRVGAGVYPAYIREWNTVKNLQKDGILTIGELCDADSEATVKIKEDLDFNVKDVESKTKVVKKTTKNLSDIAGE